MNRDVVKALLRKHEGTRLKPYKDTAGKLTIGVGRCLDAKGISEFEAELLLDNDVNDAVKQLQAMPQFCFGALNDARQHVMIDMAFNLGADGLSHFKQMLKAIAALRWDDAANEMLDSLWARQVGDRAKELAAMMRTGVV